MTSINSNTINIDEASTIEMVRMFNDEDKKVAYAVEKCAKPIAAAIDEVAYAIKHGGRAIYLGSGTSGKLSVIDASECPPTFGIDDGIFVSIISGGEAAVSGWKEETEDDSEQAIYDLKCNALSYRDIVIAVSASGNTSYALSGIAYAKELGCKTIGISCSIDGKLSEIADICIAIDVGAEAISGSTRLKAGTAQKMVLNMISSCAMIKLGKTYGNLMVDVRPINMKLKKRVVEIVMTAADCSEDEAAAALKEAGGHTKLAVLMIICGLDMESARIRLEKSEGILKKAIRGN